MNKRIKALIVALAVVVLGNTAVLADPLGDQLQNQRNQLQQDKSALKDVQDRREDIEIQLEQYDNQIEGLMDELNENKKQITEAEKDIKNTEAEVKKTQEDVKSQRELLGKRLRATYKNGMNGYLGMLFEAKSMGDFVSKLQWIKDMVDFDNKMIQELKEKEDDLNKKQQDLSQKKVMLLAAKKTNEQKITAINDSTKDQRDLIEEYKKQEKTFASKVSASQSLVNTTLSQINQIRSSLPKYNPSRGAAPISDNAIIAYASNFLGTPYVWGGNSPRPGFDCSGFTKYVYAHFGVNLSRTTYTQINEGRAVSRDQLQPGDLVFFGTSGNPHHVGIYAGNGTYIHAPRTGDVIKISPLSRSDYLTARRVK